MGLKYSGTSTSTNSAGKKAIEPSTSLNPNMMATAASDSVEMRSSTDPDSVAMRSVFTVASRKRSLTSKMRSPVAFALAEQLERVDAAHRVDEVVGQPSVLVVLARGGRLRRLADQPHVEHDDRVHDEHDQARHPVDGQHA